MKNRENYKTAIMNALGNPDSGVLADHIEIILDAIVGLEAKAPFKPDARDGDGDGLVQDGTAYERPAKETRVSGASEKR